jgi:rhodanese-related sulfurtransferase
MATAEKTIRTITPAELNNLCQKGDIDLIDVRTPVEFREVHCVHARNVPLDSLDPKKIMEARGTTEKPLYVICRSGSRGGKACEAFLNAGYTNVINVEGGTMAWDTAGFPVNRGKKAISLERQVRIAAGFLVFVGAVLALTVNPNFAALSAFVGAGLMFAGITDTCGMGMLLAKMPWNQVSSPKSTGASSKEGCSTTKPSGSCCG